ncbi:MAG: NUMOD3 domain-containing DNA-binding protein [Oscillospiraceae bacterium]
MNIDTEVKLCLCGCGQPVTKRRNGTYNDYVNHHFIGVLKPSQTQSFKDRMTGENNPSKRPEVRAKISKAVTGKNTGDSNHMRQDKYRKMFSEKFKGENNPMFGRKLSEDAKAKLVAARQKSLPDSEETRRKKGAKVKGVPKSEEHKRKISETFKTKKISDGENNPFWGKKHSEETVMFLSHKAKREHGIFEDDPRWNEIISPLGVRIRGSAEYDLWRKSVFTRDDYTCQKCGKRGGGVLQAHHCKTKFAEICKKNNIITIEEARNCLELWDIDNGITLCKKCHKEIHSI